jgi:aminoglycoside 2'-N-acetyltransferase I
MKPELTLQIISINDLTAASLAEIITLCSQAYEEDFTPLIDSFENAVHILACLDDQLVSHALWITRWLQVSEGPLLRTAYVEAVATQEQLRNQGFATAVMARLADEIADFDLGGLSPAETTLYARLGWEYWRGALFHRKDGQLFPDPADEELMILRLPNTPDLNLAKPISVEWREGEVW